MTTSHIEIVYKWKKNNLKGWGHEQGADFIEFFSFPNLEHIISMCPLISIHRAMKAP